MKSHIMGHLRIGLLAEQIPGSIVLRHLPAFRLLYPHVRFSLHYARTEGLEEGLIADELQFALTTEARANEFLASLDCGPMEYAAVAAPAYLSRRGPVDKVEKLLVSDIVDIAPHMPLLARWVGTADPDLVAILAQVSPALTVPNFHAALELLAAGAGIGFLPRKLVAAQLASGELEEVMAFRPVPARRLELLYRKKSSRPLVESLFLEHLQDALPLW